MSIYVDRYSVTTPGFPKTVLLDTNRLEAALAFAAQSDTEVEVWDWKIPEQVTA